MESDNASGAMQRLNDSAPTRYGNVGQRALSQTAALQEALDEADNEMLRMREEAEIVSIHAAARAP